MKNGSIAKQEERGNLKIKNKNMDIINLIIFQLYFVNINFMLD